MFAFPGKKEIASLIFAFVRGFTWFASGSLIYCVLLNAIVEKNSQFAIIRLSHLKSVLRFVSIPLDSIGQKCTNP